MDIDRSRSHEREHVPRHVVVGRRREDIARCRAPEPDHGEVFRHVAQRDRLVVAHVRADPAEIRVDGARAGDDAEAVLREPCHGHVGDDPAAPFEELRVDDAPHRPVDAIVRHAFEDRQRPGPDTSIFPNDVMSNSPTRSRTARCSSATLALNGGSVHPHARWSAPARRQGSPGATYSTRSHPFFAPNTAPEFLRSRRQRALAPRPPELVLIERIPKLVVVAVGFTSDLGGPRWVAVDACRTATRGRRARRARSRRP